MSFEPRLRSPNIIKRTRGAVSGPRTLPLLETDANRLFQSSYKNLIESLSNFLNHNTETVSFHQTISNQLKEMDNTYNEFIKHLCKVIPTQKGYMSPTSSPTRNIVSSSLPFFRSWQSLNELVEEVIQTGSQPIVEQIDESFIVISNHLKKIQSYAEESTSMDQLGKKIKFLNSSIVQLKSTSSQIIKRSIDANSLSHITTDLRNFSRTLNTSFRSDFGVLQMGIAESEMLRTQSYNSCSDIIYGLKALQLFDSDINRLQNSMREFQGALEAMAKKNGLGMYVVDKTPLSPTSEFSTTGISLQDLLSKTIKYIKDGGKSGAFLLRIAELVKNKVTMMEDEIVRLNRLNAKINGRTQELDKVKADLVAKIEDLQAHQKTEIVTDDSEYKSLVYGSILKMRGKLGRKDRATEEDEIIPLYRDLFDEFLLPCKKCHQNDHIFNGLQDLLDCDKESIETNVRELVRAKNNALEELHNVREMALNIASGVGVVPENYDSVVEILSKIDAKYEANNNLTQRESQETMKFVSAELIRIFNVNPDDPITTQLKHICEIQRKMTEGLRRSENDIRDVEDRLFKMTKAQRNGEPPMQNIIKMLENIESSTPVSYKTLSGIYSRLLLLANGKPTVLNAGSDYASQIYSALDSVEKSKKAFNDFLDILEKRLIRTVGSKTNLEKEIEDKKERILEYIARIEDTMLCSVTADEIRSLFHKDGDPRAIIKEASRNVENYDYSIEAVKRFVLVLDKALDSVSRAGEGWLKDLSDSALSMHNALNEVAPSRVNSTIFLLLSRFAAILSALMPLLPQRH